MPIKANLSSYEPMVEEQIFNWCDSCNESNPDYRPPALVNIFAHDLNTDVSMSVDICPRCIYKALTDLEDARNS